MKRKIARDAIVGRVIALLFGILLVGGILCKSGTVASGYHFLDDHEIVRFEYSLKHGNISVMEMIKATIKNDMNSRFRPLYWVERIAGTAIMGSNMLYWNIYKMIMGIATFYLLYLAARYLKNKWYTSALFAGIIMMGPQFTPWYRSANQENTGLFLCAIVLYFISRQYSKQKWKSYSYNIVIALFLILCGLEKESFTLMMPAFAALKFWLEYCSVYKDTKIKRTWMEILRRELIFYVSVLIAFFVNVYMILFQVGVDKVSYAGFQEETSIQQYIQSMIYSITTYLKWPFLFGVFVIVILIMCWQLFNKKQWKQYTGFAVIGFGIMALQLVVHAKSGMWERYIIPFIIGYAIIFVLLGSRFFAEDKIRRRVYAAVLTVLLLLGVQQAQKLALSYAEDGRLIAGYMNYILENTNADSKIIGAFTAGELNLATASWLEVKERPMEYAYNWNSGEMHDEVQLTELNQETVGWQNADVVLCYSVDVYTAIDMMGLTENDVYERIQYGPYAVVVRGKNGNR